jgi:hypothetical protein
MAHCPGQGNTSARGGAGGLGKCDLALGCTGDCVCGGGEKVWSCPTSDLPMGTKGVNSRHEGSSSYPRPSYIGPRDRIKESGVVDFGYLSNTECNEPHVQLVICIYNSSKCWFNHPLP